MSAPPEIPPHVRNLQFKASNPDVSVWVSANAGSGKTHVLAQRVLRLLLAGAPPAKILCLTFTKAAAAIMTERIFAALSKWTELDDAALVREIAAIGAPAYSSGTLTFARRLFARTVETPGGLKIHTIHGFCERLLHLFPFEANVSARFEVADEIGEAELLTEARRQALAAARADKAELGRAVRLLAAETSEDEFDKLIAEAANHRALLQHDTLANAAGHLGCALNLPPDTTIAKIEAEMIEAGIGPKRWRDFADFLDAGSENDCKRAALLRRAAAAYEAAGVTSVMTMAEEARGACLSGYLEIFFTRKGEKRETLATKRLCKTRPDLAEELRVEQERLDGLRDLRKAAACFEKSLALMTIVSEVFARYEHAKGARGLLDFDDLIERTLVLLERSDARWVLFKLDSGIDHILVDEAQDTSPTQWKILEALIAEFFAGAGSRASRRTFFAVGDEKQSIFSFQGAAPHMFHAMQKHFAKSFAGQAFEHVRLKDSFRSVPVVLAMVDRVFANVEHQRGLVSDDIWMGHDALKIGLPGLIEIWPPVPASEREDPRDWTLPLDMLDEADPASILAERIARKISALIAPGADECVYDTERRHFRPVTAGDILILVRTRSAFFEAVIRALKQHKVPVAGADRLDLLSHIAVMDLIAAGRAALLPQDDLTLASVLKSPLVGLDDDDLLMIAPGRPGSLFDALAAAPEAKHKSAHATILRWRGRLALSPFGFYARLLSEDGGRRAMETRLGPEACDAMDEFLRLALRAEKDGVVSLPAFLADLEGVDLSIKRDMETSGDCVRVMTIHAAKGLEAKIVFLPDTCGVPSGRHDRKIYPLEGRADATLALAWSARKDDDPTVVAAARQAARAEAEDEHRRLLYVAMTRAEERLYISGFHGATKPGELAWMRMIEASLGGDFSEAAAFWGGDEPILRRESLGSVARVFTASAETSAKVHIALPDFLTRPAPLEVAPLPPLKPSTTLAAADPTYDEDFAALPRAALERGRLMHVLLQYLPDVAEEARYAAAEAFLSARADLDRRGRAALITEALAVLTAPTLANLFGPSARVEVAVAGRIVGPDGRVREVSGQIDRIVETEREVIIADYKTGAPCDAAATPQAYLTQMALYRAVLKPLWPNKRLRMLLIWTAGPKVVELEDAQIEEALGAFYGTL